jgi:hypothetical protein
LELRVCASVKSVSTGDFRRQFPLISHLELTGTFLSQSLGFLEAYTIVIHKISFFSFKKGSHQYSDLRNTRKSITCTNDLGQDISSF